MEKGTTDITDIVFSENNEEREVEEEESVDAKVRDGSDDSTYSAEAKNGGVFNTLISSILHPNGGGDEGEGSAAADERERGADTDGDGRGGGLIHNLVSHCSAPLADDAAPATEEASMLIHSVVRD